MRAQVYILCNGSIPSRTTIYRTRMSDSQSNNKRIAKNTIMLYVRMLLSIVVSLYTSRVVLQTLGVEDYGIYGVVGGVVGILSFLNASMSGATSRFLTFAMGKNDFHLLQKTFSSAMIVHIAIAVIVFIVSETAGVWFLCNKLVIPEGRMFAAHVVLQCSIVSMLFGVTQVPYNATIIAHEQMDVYAYVELLNVFLKLGIVYLLMIGDLDKLILYAVLVLGVSVFIALVYRIYCVRHYNETKIIWQYDKQVVEPMLSFCGYDLFGNLCYSARLQGTNFLLNMFFGAAINAASGIASTVQGTLLGLSSNVTTAFKPPIIKSFANNDMTLFNYYINFGSKLSAFLLIIISIPFILNMPSLLNLWLGQIPEGAVIMCQISLFMNVFSVYSQLVVVGIHSTGKVKYLGLTCGWMYLLSLPVMYILLKLGAGYDVVYYIVALITFLYLAISLGILKKFASEFDLRRYVFQTLLPQFVISIIVYLICFFLFHGDDTHPYITIFYDGIVVITMVTILTYMTLQKNEKELIIKIIRRYVSKKNS